MSDYYVVYESSPDNGGWGFIRTITSYKDEAEFNQLYDQVNNGKVVAKGLKTYEEAALLRHHTPSVCYYTSAVEEMFEGGEPNEDLVDYHLSVATIGANAVLDAREDAGITYSAPQGFEEHLLRLCDDTYKGQMMAAVYQAYLASQDYVSPLGVRVLIKEVMSSHQLSGKKS